MKKISVFVLLILTVLMSFDLHAITSEDIEKLLKEARKAKKEKLKPIGKIWFIEPKDGAKVKNPVKFCFGQEGLKVVKWNPVNNPKEGHYHLLTDIFLPEKNAIFSLLAKPIKMIHQSEGESCHTLKRPLSPGEHSISGLFTKNDHTPQIPAIATSIKIHVEK